MPLWVLPLLPPRHKADAQTPTRQTTTYIPHAETTQSHAQPSTMPAACLWPQKRNPQRTFRDDIPYCRLGQHNRGRRFYTDCDVAVRDFGKASFHPERSTFLGVTADHRTGSEHRDDGSMAVENLEAAHHTRQVYRIGRAVVERLSRGYYFYVHGYLEMRRRDYLACERMRLPFSMASSMVPTLRKACSGRWSTSPSIIMLKPRMHSSMGTMTPGTPVNFSATVKG